MTHKIALVGFGTIGTGVARILYGKTEELRAKTGLDVSLSTVCDIDITTPRGVDVPDGVLTTNVDDVLNDPDVSLVIELVGGTTFARDLTLRALDAGGLVIRTTSGSSGALTVNVAGSLVASGAVPLDTMHRYRSPVSPATVEGVVYEFWSVPTSLQPVPPSVLSCH